MENVQVDFIRDNINSKYIDENYEENSVLIFNILKDYICNGDIEYLNNFFNAVVESKIGKTLHIVICLPDYDNDKRELYQIPEVIEYFISVLKANPAFLAIINLESNFWIPLCVIADIVKIKDNSASITINTRFAIGLGNLTVDAMKKEKLFCELDIKRFKHNYCKMLNVEESKIF